MIKKILCVIVVMCICISFTNAQEYTLSPPDYEVIKKLITNENSSFHYPKLLKRYNENDTTLTSEEYHLIYFGQALQENYQPYKIGADDFKSAYRNLNDQSSQEDLSELIELGEKSIQGHPFDLRALVLLSRLYHFNQDKDEEQVLNYKISNLLGTIYKSGDGKTCETGYHVLDVGDEYVLLEVFQARPKQKKLVGFCDCHEVDIPEYGTETIYFNAEIILTKANQLFKN